MHSRLLLAVSGGIDSVCLADYFVQNRQRLKIEWLGIAHVHHGLRKLSADRDAEFVRNLAQKFGLPFFIRHLDGNSLQKEGSIESNARSARYNALKEIASLPEVRADAVLTAHHANDQAETILMRILRGSGIRGLAGILPKRSDKIVRPFLSVTRKELCRYAADRRLDWCEDETNLDISFARNAIRRNLLPKMFGEDAEPLRQLLQVGRLAAKAHPKILDAADKICAPYIVPKSLWPFPAEVSPYEHVLALHCEAFEMLSGKSSAGAAEMLRLWLKSRGFAFPSGMDFRTNFLARNQERLFEKSRKILWFCSAPKVPAHHNLYLSRKNEPLRGEWRFRKNGDLYVPENGKPKKLKKWFEDHGVPKFVRDFLPLFASEDKVLQIYGIPPRLKDLYE